MTNSESTNLTVQEAAAGVAECMQAVVGASRCLSKGAGLERSSEFLATYPLADLTFGVLVALQGILAMLISHELIDAPSLQEDLRRRINFLKSANQAPQALPIEDLSDAVDRMILEKADVDRVLAASRHLIRSEGMQ
jgi:hypothetical protein